MTQTTREVVGDVLVGDAFVRSHYQTRWLGGELHLDNERPLVAGPGTTHAWNEKQTQPGGWERKVPHVLDTDASDTSRALARFVVVSVTPEPHSNPGPNNRDAGYGGGENYLVKRLADDESFDPDGEEIHYTRRCCYRTDLKQSVMVVGSLRHQRGT